MNDATSGKLAGKTKYSGRRRATTRSAGFKSHPDSTGGEYKIEDQQSFKLNAGDEVEIIFSIPQHNVGDVVAFGGWYLAPSTIEVEVGSFPLSKKTLVSPRAPNWSKFGSMWASTDGQGFEVVVRFKASDSAFIAFYELGCGTIDHKHLNNARPELMKNMYQFSPEAHFFGVQGDVHVDMPDSTNGCVPLHLKSCNRCARFLPINREDELVHLSFSNHCKAEHRRPCSHSGFGRLTNIDTNERIQLEYGYQLECRFCKKFEVNAAHNPQRTAAQMKEDGARRRALELLLTELYEASPQLKYRDENKGRELSDDVWRKFNKQCFNCKHPLPDQKKMHLDHTRPLALLWPLDKTATCLCGGCNSEKRDRPPSVFYTKCGQLEELSKLTSIPLDELRKPIPNTLAIQMLGKKLDWFFDKFCKKPELIKERDGKVPVELLIKAIQKTLNKYPGGAPFNLQDEYERRTSVTDV